MNLNSFTLKNCQPETVATQKSDNLNQRITVFVSQYKSDADLVVYETKYKSEATDNSGVWYFCKYKSDADRKIYFCDYKSDADIVIYFSKYKSDAGWKKNEKKHLMYKKN